MRWVLKGGLLHSFLVVILFLAGVVSLIVFYDRIEDYSIETKWRREGQAATGVVTGFQDGFRGEGFSASFYTFAVVQIEGSDGVVYRALMDREVGPPGSIVDLVYIPEEPPVTREELPPSKDSNQPVTYYVVAEARVRTPRYLSYNAALDLAVLGGLVVAGIFLLWSARWMHRNVARS